MSAAARIVIAGVVLACVAGSAGAAAKPKYYFQIQDVKGGPEIDASMREFTAAALKSELAGRPEWASDLGPGTAARPGEDRAALTAALKSRGLRGFDVTVRFEKFTQDLKDPKPGARNKQLALDVRLSVFGTTIPDGKLAFSGDGESGVEAEVSDRSLDAERASAAHDVIKDALKQAVDQAVTKLALGASQPVNEKHRHKK